MQDYRIVWIASIPRTGSMWTFNVIRSMLDAAGLTVLPKRIPQSDREMFTCADESFADTDARRVRVLKVHSKVAPQSTSWRFIHTVRDPRDALVSFMRFMKFEFDRAVHQLPEWTSVLEHYGKFPDDICHRIHYPDLIGSPRNVVEGIARFLDIKLDAAQLDDLARRYSKDNVRRLVKRTEEDLRARAAAGRPVSREEVVTHRGVVMRVFDTRTGFQSGHVSNYREGDWRTLFSAVQQRRLAALFGDWLRCHGFEDD